MNKLDIYNLYLLDFAYVFNKSRQRLSDVILQGDSVAVIPTLAKKITSELAEVNIECQITLITVRYPLTQ